MILVSAISSPKQIILFFVLFFYLPQFLSYRNHLHWDLSLRQIFRVVAFVPVITLQKQLWSWCRSSVTLSFRATGTIFIGNRTQDSLSGL
jgi:hypothetical protein